MPCLRSNDHPSVTCCLLVDLVWNVCCVDRVITDRSDRCLIHSCFDRWAKHKKKQRMHLWIFGLSLFDSIDSVFFHVRFDRYLQDGVPPWLRWNMLYTLVAKSTTSRLRWSVLVYFFDFLNCIKFDQDWTNLILHLYKGSPFGFLWISRSKKIKQGTLTKCVISSLFNIYQTLYSLAIFKNKQVAKIWSL